MKIEQRVTNEVCAQKIGVGRPTVIAVRRMLGLSGARKIYPSTVQKFLLAHQDFRIADAEDMAAFKARHPKFVLPT